MYLNPLLVGLVVEPDDVAFSWKLFEGIFGSD
jgi:hypothetical protein